MKSFKVEIKVEQTYVFDVQAETETEAQEIASKDYFEKEEQGTVHYHLTSDSYEPSVFDVTGTDDDAFINDNQ